jgi:putative toxin-antitoxin system antitoxin component (TIGR02293 family)
MSPAPTRQSPKPSRNGKAAPRRTARRAAVTAGVVRFYVHGATGKSSLSPAKTVERLRAGLPIEELHDLQVTLAVPMEKLGSMLGISKATLHRRKARGRLDPAESDRIVRFARLMGKALDVMESEDGARQWLNSPQFGLGGAVPLEFAETEVGAREVEQLLGRIEYGVYS